MSKIKNDQFYTKKDVSQKCVEILLNNYPELVNKPFIEPSAGEGSFLSALENYGYNNVLAFDIEPKNEKIKQGDFLSQQIDDKMVAIGNPPFGHRSKLAIDFFNKCAEFCDTIAFIVPLQFRKYSVQSKLNKDFCLVSDTLLDSNSFEHDNKDLSVRCCFQIWTKSKDYLNLRIKERPEISHPDFEMYLYNNTPQALKFFDYDWDFAVPRQGYYDYSLRIKNKNELSTKVQYMFFKAKNQNILNNLINLDFDMLSKKNTTTPGFGKADIIELYKSKYNLK